MFGFSKLTEVTKSLAPILAWEMENRGKDAWGATNGEEIVKHLGPITESWRLPDWEQGIFHTRAASTGSGTKIENAHPFEFVKENGSRVIGIHNGIIRAHEELNKKYNREFEVDSMHIFAHLAEGRSLKEIEGYGALAWYEDGILNLAKFNMYDLHICLLETEEIVFCSRFDPIRKGSRMFGSKIKTDYNVKEKTRYKIYPNAEGKDTLWECGDLPFGERTGKVETTGGRVYQWPESFGTYQRPTVREYHGTFTTQGLSAEEKCVACGTRAVDRKKAMFCWICLEKEVECWRLMHHG